MVIITVKGVDGGYIYVEAVRQDSGLVTFEPDITLSDEDSNMIVNHVLECLKYDKFNEGVYSFFTHMMFEDMPDEILVNED